MVRGSGAPPPRGAVRGSTEPRLPLSGLVRSGMRGGPTGRGAYPPSPIDAAVRAREDGRMEVISPSQPARRPSLGPLLGGTILGTVLVVTGIVLAYVALATPALRSAMPTGRLDAGQVITGVTLWGIALVAPAGFVLFGTSRLVRILATVRGRIPRKSTVLRALDGVVDDVIVASGLALPDGRAVSELVIGPFGAAVIRDLPPAAVTRVREGRWRYAPAARGSRSRTRSTAPPAMPSAFAAGSAMTTRTSSSRCTRRWSVRRRRSAGRPIAPC